MNTRSHAPLYDLFKLVVAIMLLIIFLFLMWGVTPSAPPPQPATPTPPPPTFSAVPDTSTAPTPTETPPPPIPSTTLRASFTALPVISTSPAPTETPLPAPLSTTETNTPSPTSSPTLPPVTETLPTPIVEIPSEPDACAAISRARLQVGMRATILRRLNFRSSPGIMNNWILTNIPGTEVEVLGGPVCTRYQNGGSYLWWQIKLPNGMVGWSAEASAFGGFYFIEPVP